MSASFVMPSKKKQQPAHPWGHPYGMTIFPVIRKELLWRENKQQAAMLFEHRTSMQCLPHAPMHARIP